MAPWAVLERPAAASLRMDRSPVYRRPVQFRVLGPLEVDAGDGPIPLGGPKQRAVLANLLVRANQVVPADALIDDVWGEDAPEKARHILQTYVSSLRKTLGDGRLEGRPPGYLLVVGPPSSTRIGSTRSSRKRPRPCRSIRRSRSRRSTTPWRCGVAPRLPTSSEQPSLLAEAARLDELRVEAQEDRIEALLATGAQANALAELEPLLARASAPREPVGPGDARLLQGRSTGRGAQRLRSRTRAAGGRTRHGSLTGALEAARADPEAGPRAGPSRGAAARIPSPGEDRFGVRSASCSGRCSRMSAGTSR